MLPMFCRDGKNRWLAKNDNGFSYRENFSVWPSVASVVKLDACIGSGAIDC